LRRILWIDCFKGKELFIRFNNFYCGFVIGLSMSQRWVGRNVNLDSLSRYIERFLEDRNFKTRKRGLAGGFIVEGVSRQQRGLLVKVVVRILGDPNDFSVELGRDERAHTRLYNVFGPFMTLFGGGFILARNLKRQDILDRLETEFFVFVEEKVDYLAV